MLTEIATMRRQTGLRLSCVLEIVNFRHLPDILGRVQLVKLGLGTWGRGWALSLRCRCGVYQHVNRV